MRAGLARGGRTVSRSGYLATTAFVSASAWDRNFFNADVAVAISAGDGRANATAGGTGAGVSDAGAGVEATTAGEAGAVAADPEEACSAKLPAAKRAVSRRRTMGGFTRLL